MKRILCVAILTSPIACEQPCSTCPISTTVDTNDGTTAGASDSMSDTSATSGGSSDGSSDGSSAGGSSGDEPTGQCIGEAPDAGFPWGPCREDRTCLEGFGCEYIVDPGSPQGSLCAPLCFQPDAGGDLQCPFQDDAVNTCGEALGKPTCERSTACALFCESDSDCHPDLRCFGARCLWPEP